jgi:hypothetical protein
MFDCRDHQPPARLEPGPNRGSLPRHAGERRCPPPSRSP